MTSVKVPDSAVNDPRVYFAAERTLLAWIRTGLAMMGFGFVVARLVPLPHGSLWFGTGLVLVGVMVNLLAALQHTRLVHQLRKGTWNPNHASRSGIALAIALALAGVAVTTYLLFA